MRDGTHDDVTLSGVELSAFGKNDKEGVGFTAILPDGETIDGVLWLTTEKAQKRTEESLRYAGWAGDWNDLSSAGTQKVQIVVATEEGRQSVKWVNANHSRGGGGKALSSAARQRLVARLSGQPAPDFGPGDDDIPF